MSASATPTKRVSPPSHLVLGIETSCDDTAAAVVNDRGQVLSSVVSNQLAAHQPFGGVVPEIASREHLKNWPPVLTAALEDAGIKLGQVDAVAVTSGPGLVGSLLVGLSIGRGVALALQRPFFAVHHLEGHLYSPFIDSDKDAMPTEFLGLVVSGGHTNLYRVRGSSIATLGSTRDDAMGEAFDKVGKRVGLEYPQGPKVDRIAEDGDASRFDFTLPQCGGTLDFSYSGLKTQAVNLHQRLLQAADNAVSDRDVRDLLAGFRAAAVDQILDRLQRLDPPSGTVLAVSGGAAANLLLRRRLKEWANERDVDLRLVEMKYSGDNAAMIAHAAVIRNRFGSPDDPLRVEAASRLPLTGSLGTGSPVTAA